MVLEIREREGKGHGELARVARQLGVHPEAPPRGPADFPAHRMRLAATPASGSASSPDTPRSRPGGPAAPGQDHGPGPDDPFACPGRAGFRGRATDANTGPEPQRARNRVRCHGLAPDLSPPSRRRTAAVMRARAVVDRYDALTARAGVENGLEPWQTTTTGRPGRRHLRGKDMAQVTSSIRMLSGDR
jgi:hypothetical protein